MRVAIISEVFLPKIDGVVTRTLNLLQQLAAFGDDVMVVCPQAEGCDSHPAHVVGVPSFSFPLYPEYRIGIPDQTIAERVKRFGPDVIHYINPFAFGFRCHDVFRRAGVFVPTVFSFHTVYGDFAKQYKGMGLLSRFLWWLMREYHNRADVNLTVSSIMQHDLIRRGFKRVELWPPAVDNSLFHPARKDLGMRVRLSNGRPDRPLFLTVSRLAPEKNVGFLADVLKAVPGAQLAIVGDGPQRADLERKFQGTSTHFVGYLKGEELATAYSSSDLFVFASEIETMANVVLEAMAGGCPVVAPNAGGIPSLINHGEDGYLYRPKDVEAVAQFARKIAFDPELRQRFSVNARQSTERRSWRTAIGRVREVYAEAILGHELDLRRVSRKKSAETGVFGLVTMFRKFAEKKQKQKSRLDSNALSQTVATPLPYDSESTRVVA